MSRNRWISLLVVVVFILSLLIVFPVAKGVLGGKPIRLGLDLQGGTRVTYSANFTETSIPAGQRAAAIQGAIAVLENRLNPLGVSETTIRALGSDQIVVEIPGKTLTAAEKESLGRVALLEFGELVTGNVTDNSTIKWTDELGSWKPATGVVDNQTRELTSSYFQDNTYVSTTSTTAEVVLNFNWNPIGTQLSTQITTRLLNQRLGIFEGDQPLRSTDGRPIAPVVQSVISERGVIEGLNAPDAQRLSKQLNAGRLPVPLVRTGDEQDVEPVLGSRFVTLSVRAGLITLIIVMLFMIAYYRVSGAIASAAVIYYGILLFAIFKLFNVTMTLSAIGGFVLSLGMAVDANVLIFERMKEELWGGRTLGAAIDAGFGRAWPAIWDSNITTIIAGVILLWLGSSNIASSAPVKGFAVTLIIGIVSSMFTAVTVTRALLRPFAGTEFANSPGLFAPFQRKKQ